MKKKKVLVLGHKGMLGNCVHRYLSQFYEIITTDYRFPDPDFLDFVRGYEGVIVNCIGAIPQKTDVFIVNFELPIFLSTLNCPVIHPGTDCENDMDPYGISKKRASDYVKTQKDAKIIQTSIIGLGTNYGLLSWFLQQFGEAQGYTNAMWNGVTTLEWAKHCFGMIENWDEYESKTVICSDCVSKYELLVLAKKAFEKRIKIVPVEKGENKCLKGIYTKHIYQQLKELRAFYE